MGNQDLSQTRPARNLISRQSPADRKFCEPIVAESSCSVLAVAFQRFSDLRYTNSPVETTFADRRMPHYIAQASVAKPDVQAPVVAGCTECVTDCREPSCPVDMTPQCTDKCVVVACNDTSHSEMSCHGGGADPHCNVVCNHDSGCTDCTGFEEFVSHQQFLVFW